jgi:hypothetical protein
MDAGFSVELSEDDPTLAVPWRSPEGAITYMDLKQYPELMDGLSEVRKFPELGAFLRTLNAPDSPFETAKCDAWFDTLMDVDDEPFEAAMKCSCYVDLFLSGERKRTKFAEQEASARMVAQRLRETNDVAARVEIILRRAYFADWTGFYWTVYVFGYGDGVDSASSSWQSALRLLQTALLEA